MMVNRLNKRKKVVIVCIIILILFVIARYSWRIKGFQACNSIYSVDISVSEEVVNIEGYTVDPFGHFIGHVYKIDGDKMYVGVKEREFLGVLPGDKGEFHIQIPVTQQINEVYWCANNYERLEWKR